jgi:hypothetical protein
VEVLFGLFVWQAFMAGLALLVHLWRKRALKDPAQAPGLVWSACAIAIGAVVGAVPILALASLLTPLEALLVSALPLCVGAVLVSVLKDRPRFAVKDPGGKRAV